MDERDLTTYARSMSAALHVIGPTPRAQVVGMLRVLNLTEIEAIAVVVHALAQGILAEDGTALRAVWTARRG